MLLPIGLYASTTMSLVNNEHRFQPTTEILWVSATYILRAPVEQARLLEVWVRLDLVDCRFDLGRLPQLLDALLSKVGDAYCSDLAIFHHLLHLLPRVGHGYVNDCYLLRCRVDWETLDVISWLK